MTGWIGAREQSLKRVVAPIFWQTCATLAGSLWPLLGGARCERADSGLAVARHENGHEQESHIVLPLAVSSHLCIISPTAAGQGERVYFE
jgi:hypothetical protein